MTKHVWLKINRCMECPKIKYEKTIGAGCADDYLCGAKRNKLIAGYIEWPSEEPKEVPKWCPLRSKKNGNGNIK